MAWKTEFREAAATFMLVAVTIVFRSPGAQAEQGAGKDCIPQLVSEIVSSLRDSEHSLGTPFVYSHARACFKLGDFKLFLDCLKGIAKLHKVIEPKGLIDIHSTKIAEIVSSNQFRKRLETFSAAMARVNEDLKNGIAPKKSLWEVALSVTNGNRDEAIDFLMLFVQDRESNGLVKRLKKSGVEDADELFEELQRVRGSLYSAVKGLSSSRSPINFGFPDLDGNPAFGEVYHFWDAAFISKELVVKGVEPSMARYLAMLNGESYERLTDLTSKWQGKPASSDHPLNHIAYHVRGAYFGTTAKISDIPSQARTIEFIQENIRNHYRAIARGTGDRDFTEAIRQTNEADRKKILIGAIFAAAVAAGDTPARNSSTEATMSPSPRPEFSR